MQLLIADDHRLFCDGLRGILLQLRPDTEISVAENGKDALEILCADNDLDLAFIDLRLPVYDGFSLLDRVSAAGCLTPIIIISASTDPRDAKRALETGAMGYITKSSSGIELLDAAERVLSGQTVCPLLEKATPVFDGQTRWARMHHITPRQLEVLRLVKRGLSNQEIAGKLHISMPTVKTHIASLFDSLQAKSRSEVIQKATQLGLD